MRGGGGSGGLTPPPPKCARKCANFRNLKANVQILDRKTPPPQMVYPISPTAGTGIIEKSPLGNYIGVTVHGGTHMAMVSNINKWLGRDMWAHHLVLPVAIIYWLDDHQTSALEIIV